MSAPRLNRSVFALVALSALAVLPVQAHKQHVHQYIAREAYLLLRSSLGADVPQLQEHIGGLDPFYAGDSAWQRPFVTTGSWREDEEDVVFHYDAYEISPGLNYALVSITHFWDADQGDSAGNIFRLRIEQPPFPPLNIDIGPYENAYDKFLRYAEGGWVVWYPRAFTATNTANGHLLVLAPLPLPAAYGIPFSYDGLTDFYTFRVCTLRTDQNIVYTVYDETSGQYVDPATVSTLLVGNDVRDGIVWEILGRMCHLLADMSVPAHAHRDEHGLNPDSYEEYLGGAGDPFTAWDHRNVGALIDPSRGANEPLHYLIYILQQLSDHFGSNGPAEGDGNDIAGGNPRSAETMFLDSVALSSLGPPTSQAGPWTTGNLMNIRDRTFPVTIRATAGLLLWFCRETQLVTGVEGGISGFIPGGFQLRQNYPNPFNGETKIGYRIQERGDNTPVTLKVYDVLGRVVATLVDGPVSAGEHTVHFDATGLASGVYIYRLQTRPLSGGEAGAVVGTQRMILIK